MERILQLMQEKNHFLEKFYKLNETQYLLLLAEDYTGLDNFYNDRENLIKILQYCDQQMTEENRKTAFQAVSMQMKQDFQRQMKIKDQYVNELISQDLKIISEIERAKSKTIRDLYETKVTKKALGKYKGPTSGNLLKSIV